MNGATILETMLRRDRVVVMGALGVIAGLAWAYIGYLAWEMQEMGGGGAVSFGLVYGLDPLFFGDQAAQLAQAHGRLHSCGLLAAVHGLV